MRDLLPGFALGIFHAAVLLLLLVSLLMLEGGGRVLQDIGTQTGALIGLWLAFLSVLATTWSLRRLDLERAPTKDVIGRAGLGGFVAGALFVAGVLLVLGFAAGRLEPQVLVVVVFASPFAGAAGALIAMGLAGLDLAIARATDLLMRRAAGSS